MKKFRILSIDGGGLRGIVPLLILQRIEELSGRRIHEMFDLISGTSTGGLIACIANINNGRGQPRHSLKDVEEMYANRGGDIFPQHSLLGGAVNKVTSLFSPEFSARGIDRVLDEYLGGLRLTDCLTPVIIPAYDLHNNSPIFFKSRHAKESAHENAQLFDVCRATSAGPTFLPSHTFLHPGGPQSRTVTCVDGGVYINNPAMGALAEALKYHDGEFYGCPELKRENIHLLSLGTGSYTKPITEKESVGWGKLQWIRPLIDTTLYGTSQAVDYQVREFLTFSKVPTRNYLRLSIDISDPRFSVMTNSSKAMRDYLRAQVESQVFGNATLMDDIKAFIANAA